MNPPVSPDPLAACPPPYAPYRQWLRLPVQPAVVSSQVAEELGGQAAAFMRRLGGLGPLYGGRVPLAAVFLQEAIRAGVLPVAVHGQPGRPLLVPVAELAAALPAATSSASEVGKVLHELHRAGHIVMDDLNVLHQAVPPAGPDDAWSVSGFEAAHV